MGWLSNYPSNVSATARAVAEKRHSQMIDWLKAQNIGFGQNGSVYGLVEYLSDSIEIGSEVRIGDFTVRRKSNWPLDGDYIVIAQDGNILIWSSRQPGSCSGWPLAPLAMIIAEERLKETQ